MRRGDVYLAQLDPTRGSEQSGTRPVIIVSRDAINRSSPVIVVVPCTSFRAGRTVYPSQLVLRAPDGGLRNDSLVLGEQVRAVAKSRLRERWGTLASDSLSRLERALAITLDLPEPG